MGSLGFSKSKSQSQSSSQQSSFVDPAQQGFLQDLRTQAQQLQGDQSGRIGELRGLSDRLGGIGSGFIDQLQGFQQQLRGGVPGIDQGAVGGILGGGQAGIEALTGIAQGTNPALQALQAQASGQNPQLQNQIGQLGQDISRDFLQQINPGITGGAVQAGQLGSSRQGVAQGLAQQGALDAFSRGATQLRSDDIGRQLQASQAVLGQQQGAAGQLGGFQQGALQAQLGQGGLTQAGILGGGQLGLGGLGSLQGLFNLGLSPFEAEFSPLQNLAGIVGGPTVLSQGTSQGTGQSSSFSANVGVG